MVLPPDSEVGAQASMGADFIMVKSRAVPVSIVVHDRLHQKSWWMAYILVRITPVIVFGQIRWATAKYLVGGARLPESAAAQTGDVVVGVAKLAT